MAPTPAQKMERARRHNASVNPAVAVTPNIFAISILPSSTIVALFRTHPLGPLLNSGWLALASPVGTPQVLAPRIRIFWPYGKTPTLTFLFSSLQSLSTRN